MSGPTWLNEEWIVERFESIDEAQDEGSFEWATYRRVALAMGAVGVVWKQIGDGSTGLPGRVETTYDRACLIAEAPNLYRELEMAQRRLCDTLCMRHDTLTTSHHPDCQSARKALSKARGETNEQGSGTTNRD